MVELTVSTAILATVFASLMPVFVVMRNHADVAAAGSERVQNARILNEQLYRHLAQAERVIAMSAAGDSDGHLEFEAADGVVRGFRLGSNGGVEFGPVNDLHELAGPVEYLKFTCYDGNDPAMQTDTAAHVRLVTWEAGPVEDRAVRGACYLRVGPGAGSGESNAAYDFAAGRQGVDCFAFAGEDKPHEPRTLLTPSAALDARQYDAIEAQDRIFHQVDVLSQSNYAQMRSVFEIRENRSDVLGMTATWRGKGVNGHSSRTDGASLYLWNFSSGTYELLQASPDTEAEITLTGSRDGAPSRCIGGPGGKTVVLLVVSNDRKAGHRANTLFTDYVRLDVRSAGSAGIRP